MATGRLMPKFLCVLQVSRRLASGTKAPSAAVTAGEEARKSAAFYHGFPLAYPDFLPSPVQNRRNPLFMELVHADMLQRRLVLEIPEFYVGSVLAITMSDPNLSDRKNRFVGICVSRHKEGLFHQITLRNVIDGLGVEVMYELYTPTILKIEVLRLERRLDDDLSYLIDALPEYSTFDFDMEPVPHPIGKPVPVNPLKVKLRPPPWACRWDIYEFKGIEDSWTNQTPHYRRKLIHTSKLNYTQKYDVVQHYRDASQEFEHDVATQRRMLQFEAGNEQKLNEDADGGRKRRILRLIESAE